MLLYVKFVHILFNVFICVDVFLIDLSDMFIDIVGAAPPWRRRRVFSGRARSACLCCCCCCCWKWSLLLGYTVPGRWLPEKKNQNVFNMFFKMCCRTRRAKWRRQLWSPARRHKNKSWKVPLIVTVYSTFTRALTFQTFKKKKHSSTTRSATGTPRERGGISCTCAR